MAPPVARVLRSVELHRLDFSFREPVGTAAGVHRLRPVAFVRVETDAGEGFGECAALAGGTAVDAPFDVVWNELIETGVPRLVAAARARGGELPSSADVAGMFGSGPAAHATAAVLEMAVLDAELRLAGEPLWSRLGVEDGAASRGVPVGTLVGIPADRSIGALLSAVAGRAGRAARVRCKIEPGWDVEPLRALRAAFPELALQADANGSYRLDGAGPDDAARLEAVDELGLECIEQPLPAPDLGALARLAARLATPVCLDESLTSLGRVLEAVRCGACEVACIKPARLGGLLRARAAGATLAGEGVPTFVGGFFETPYARAANAALAGLPAFSLPGDLSDPSEYLDGPLAAPYLEMAGGVRAVLSDAPGVAPAPLLGAPRRTWRL